MVRRVRKIERNTKGRVIIREPVSMEHGMAPRLQVTDPAESIRKKRAPADRQRGRGRRTAGGGGKVSHGQCGFLP